MKPSPWRTAGTLAAFGLMIVAALCICRSAAQGPTLLPIAVGGLVTLGVAAAGKASFEHWTKKGQP